jgi:hypothetical protein
VSPAAAAVGPARKLPIDGGNGVRRSGLAGSRLRPPGACESRQGTWLPPADREGDDLVSLPLFDAVSFDLSLLRARAR